MKKLGITLLLALVALQFGCKETEYVESAPQLEFTIVKDNLVFVEGATISLYTTQDDWETHSNVVQSLQTDSKGQALFEELEEQRYYFFVEQDELNNLTDIAATAEPLKIGQKSQVLVKIANTNL